MLGPDRFGLYSLVMSIVTFSCLFARLGINETVRRYVAELDGRGQRAVAAIVAGRSLQIGLVSAGTAAVLLALAAAPLAAFFHHAELRAYLLLGAATVAPMMATGLLRSVLRGIQQYHYFVRMNLATSPLWLVATTLVVWRGGGIAAVLAVGLLIQLLNLAALGWWTGREVGIRWRAPLPAPLRARLLHYNLVLAVLLLLNAIVWQRSELLFLGRLQDAEQVAFYALPFALTERLTSLLPGALLGVLLPGLTYLQGAGDPARFTAALSDALRYLAMLTLPVCLFGIPLAPAVIAILYGPRFSQAALVLQLLLVAMIFGVLGQASSSALLGLEAQGWLLKTGVIAAVVNLALDLALIPRWGAVGAALANTAAQAGWALAAFAPLRRRITPSTWRAILHAAAVAMALGTVLALLPLFRLATPAFLLVGIAVTGFYVLTLERLHLFSVRSALAVLRANG